MVIFVFLHALSGDIGLNVGVCVTFVTDVHDHMPRALAQTLNIMVISVE